jgi:hypothetical protein
MRMYEASRKVRAREGKSKRASIAVTLYPDALLMFPQFLLGDNLDSAVGIATGRPRVRSSSTGHPDRLWGPHTGSVPIGRATGA